MGWMAALGAVSTTLGVIGQLQQSQGRQLEYRARATQFDESATAHDYNASVSDVNAAQAYSSGLGKEELVRSRARQILGKQIASIGQSGIEGGTGSALLVQQQSAANAELDSMMVLYNADLEARANKAKAASERYAAAVDRNNADMARAAARQARTSGYLSALAAGVSGVTQIKF